MSNSVIEVKDLYFRYEEDGPYVLNNLSLNVYKGEWLAIAGHNGSGKSTLAKILNGLILPEQGSVKVADLMLTEDSVWDVRRHIGMVFQNPDNQFVGSTVEDDVAFGLENNGFPYEEMRKRVEEAIEVVGMKGFEKYEPHRLSGGQKQRIGIAGVVAMAPDVILLDEATSMLDPKGRSEVLETIRLLKNQRNLTIISITHDLNEVAKADRAIVLNKGELFAIGTPSEIFELGSKLTEIGLDFPFASQISHVLRDKGISLEHIHLTTDNLVEELWRLYSKM
jgi:energy-coupling factor transport system ATP-binding protein